MAVKILKKIKIARLSQGITQEDMAKKLNISIPTYSRFERGITKTAYHLILDVCQILAIDFDLHDEYILGDIEAPNNKADGTTNNVKIQLDKLIYIAEEQQKMNALLLKKLKYIAENCTCV